MCLLLLMLFVTYVLTTFYLLVPVVCESIAATLFFCWFVTLVALYSFQLCVTCPVPFSLLFVMCFVYSLLLLCERFIGVFFPSCVVCML